MNQRLNKVLSELGYGSRRSIDRQISEGKIQVNQELAHLGQRVSQTDSIKINNKGVTRNKPKPVLIAFFKPVGVMTTKQDPFATSTVMDYLPANYHQLLPVGRLDKQSRGLILLTNNGEFVNRVTHPKYGHAKEYIVKVVPTKKKKPEEITHDLNRLTREIIDRTAQSKPVDHVDFSFPPEEKSIHVRMIITEGQKRQIRRLFEALGYNVIDLLRTRIDRFSLDDLKEGEYRNITPADWQ